MKARGLIFRSACTALATAWLVTLTFRGCGLTAWPWGLLLLPLWVIAAAVVVLALLNTILGWFLWCMDRVEHRRRMRELRDMDRAVSNAFLDLARDKAAAVANPDAETP